MVYRLLVIALLVSIGLQTSTSAKSQADDSPAGPIAHTPDAETVMQSAMSQSEFPSIPVSVVFTEYTFANSELALAYFGGICSYLEVEMSSISPEGMNYIDLPIDGNPMCGFSRMKGTQAYGAVVNGTQVLTIWAFGIGVLDDTGDFLRTFMKIDTVIMNTASLPVAADVASPWRVDYHDVDITEFARTAYELRD